MTEGVLILGAPRSGTTLLRRLLDAHPGLCCPPETCLFSACARFLHSEVVSDGLEFGVAGALELCGLPEEELLERLRGFAFSLLSALAARNGKPRWVEKTAVNVFHLPQIERLCGDRVSYVCLIRHGLDVVCSLKEFTDRAQTYLSELHGYVGRHPRPLEAFAHAWCDATEAVLDLVARRPGSALLVRYEDLVGDPEAGLRRILEFLGEPWEAGLLEGALGTPIRSPGFDDWKAVARSHVDASSVGRWKGLARGSLERLARLCNPLLERCGYARIEVEAGEARRRYQLGIMLQALKEPREGS